MEKRKKILIVEDSYIVALHLQRTLESSGYDVVRVCDSYEESLATANTSSIDLAFMDVMLNDSRDGIEIASMLWQKFRIPVVFITALSDNITLKRIKEAHAFGYLTKPFQDRDIINVMELAFYKFEAEIALHNSREQFFSVVQSISDPLITVNTEYKITYINPSAEMLTGWMLYESIGRNFDVVFKVVDIETKEPVQSPLYCNVSEKKGNSLIDTFLLISKKGEEIPIGEGTINPMYNASGDLTGMVILFRNLSSRYRELKYQQQLEFEKRLSLQKGEELERKRLSRDLHDGLGQLLNFIKMKIDHNVREATDVSELMDTAIDEVSRIADELLPAKLRHFNLGTAIKSLCDRESLASGVKIIFNGTTEKQPVNQDSRLSIYRIFQEGVHNAIRHGKADVIEVEFNRKDDTLMLIIKDNGIGFDPDQLTRKNGLINMQERADLLKATLQIHSQIGQGTVLILNMPISNNANEETFSKNINVSSYE